MNTWHEAPSSRPSPLRQALGSLSQRKTGQNAHAKTTVTSMSTPSKTPTPSLSCPTY